MKKTMGASARASLRLAGCRAGEPPASVTTPTAGPAGTASPYATAVPVPGIMTGKPLREAASALFMASIESDYYRDGAKFSVGPGESTGSILSPQKTKAGKTLPPATQVNPNVKDLLGNHDGAGVFGAAAMKKTYMPDTRGAVWPACCPAWKSPRRPARGSG